jgi:eukaryotic-like serine/threonine-protein kinase
MDQVMTSGEPRGAASAESGRLAVGVQIGAFRIERVLGHGGMGTVYLAVDTKLNRRVAIKLLSDDLADAAARRRFQREAQTASSLNHPHILTVHDVGEFEGRQYLVTEYVDCGTLRDWAVAEKRSWRQILEMLTGVADGLAAAHGAGILHRDIKPENILVAQNGYAKLADFGLAKLAEASEAAEPDADDATRPGLIVGTVAYMSPEQASGKRLDARSDVFSFGVVLYEMLAGKRPFSGASDLEVLKTIVEVAPKPLPDEIPIAVRIAVEKALEKDPADRYQSMRDLVVDLRRAVRQKIAEHYRVELDAEAATAGSTSQPLGRPRVASRRWAAGALVLLLAAAVVIWRQREVLVPPSPAPIRSLAVLPLENLSGDPEQEYFADGMTEALIGELARLGALSVISRTSVMRYKDARKPLPEIARELGVEGILEGTVMRSGDRVRIQAQLIDARTDRHLWNDRFDRSLSDVLALQADVARAVAQQVRLELTPQEHARLASRSVDPVAYDAYLRGRELVGPAGQVRVWAPGAIAQLERAVEIDPNLAEGWAWIAHARMAFGIWGMQLRDREQYPKARQAAQRALDIDERLGMAHAVLGFILMQNDWDFAAAEREFERAMELSPGDPTVVTGLAWYLLVTGKTDQGLVLSEQLPRIAPYDLYFRGEHFRHLRFARRYDRALEELARVRQVDPTFTDPVVSHLYFALGRLEEAQRAWIAFCERCGKRCDPMREAALRGWAEGGWAGSMRAVAEFDSAIKGFSPNAIAIFYSLAGNTDEAFAWLEEGYRQRDPVMVNVRGMPAFDPLRSDPRFDDLVRRIGFPVD